MAELSSKDKLELAFIYELNEYRSLKKLLTNERLNISTKLLLIPADDVKTIADMQGQAKAFKYLNLLLKNISKETHKN